MVLCGGGCPPLATIRSFWYISISICCKICRSKVLELGHKISTELIKAQFTLILLPWDSVIRVYLFVKRGRMWPAKYSICVWCLVTAIWIFLGCIWIWKSNHDGLLADASPRPEPGRDISISAAAVCRQEQDQSGPHSAGNLNLVTNNNRSLMMPYLQYQILNNKHQLPTSWITFYFFQHLLSPWFPMMGSPRRG